MRKNFASLITLFIIGTIISGCGLLIQETSTKPDGTNKDLPQAYPQPNAGGNELSPEFGYPLSPTLSSPKFAPEGVVSKIEVPTPSGKYIVITGRMVSSDYDGPPYIGDIYLGFLVQAEQEDYPPIIKFSDDFSPKGIVDVEGNFYFSEVDAGDYALIIYSLGGTYIVLDDSGETLYIKGEAGKSYDLGTIIIP